MRGGLLAALVLAGAACDRSTSTGQPCNLAPAPAASAVPVGALGDPCATGDAACATGLACSKSVPGGAFALNVCTVDCADGGCPEGAACAPGASPVCMPACHADSDCRQGERAGTCTRYADGGVCEPLSCAPPGYAGAGPSCPDGFTCVGFQPCGCDPRYPCDEAPGWCQRTR